jgi:phosphate/phosphite/phosphonate ABC transporter binding protein
MRHIFLILTGLAFFIFLISCSNNQELKNSIVWAYVSEDENTYGNGFDDLLALIEEGIDKKIIIKTYKNQAGLLEALENQQNPFDIAVFDALTYLDAGRTGKISPGIVGIIQGNPTFTSQIVVRNNSDINRINNLTGASFAVPDLSSIEGWIIPKMTLISSGIDPEQDLSRIISTGSHEEVLLAVYNGTADAGATYVDARIEESKEKPEIWKDIKVIALTEDIPNTGIFFHTDLEINLKNKIINRLIKLSDTAEGKKLLSTVFSWADLITVNDTFYDPVRKLFKTPKSGN